MSTTRKRTATTIKQASNNIPIDYSYPQYGYVQPPVYNPEYMYPAPSYQNPEYMQPTPLYRNPEYIYPKPSYQNVEYVYYPVDQNGQIIGPPTTFPPIVNPPHQESHPYSDRISNIPARRSYIHSSRDRTLDEDYHHHHHHHHHHRHSHHRHEKSKRETLPPINKHVFIFFLFLSKINFFCLL
jgi:hypothetical protein